MNAIVVKIGSSTLVDTDGLLREATLDRLARDLARLVRMGRRPVLVSSGAVAAGLGTLGLAGRPATLPMLQATSAVGQGLLFERYRSLLAPHGATPAQVLLTSADLERREPYLNARNLLAWNAGLPEAASSAWRASFTSSADFDHVRTRVSGSGFGGSGRPASFSIRSVSWSSTMRIAPTTQPAASGTRVQCLGCSQRSFQ
jgi:hypothetical protein